MAILIDGKKTAADIRAEIAAESFEFFTKFGRKPSLAVIRAGDDPASAVYVRNKVRACEDCGFISQTILFPADAADAEIIKKIEELNDDRTVDGILVQLPLPGELASHSKEIIDAVDPYKDADAFHSLDSGHLKVDGGNILPCTPAGIIELLKRYGVPVEGREAVVIGRSDIVGRPAAALLLEMNATVTIAHSRTRNLPEVVRRGDIVVSAVGRAGLITGDMLKPGCALIDVGMNRDANGKLCGDADFESCEKVAGYITPVPGGVGPMTVCMLMRNTMNAAIAHEKAR